MDKSSFLPKILRPQGPVFGGISQGRVLAPPLLVAYTQAHRISSSFVTGAAGERALCPWSGMLRNKFEQDCAPHRIGPAGEQVRAARPPSLFSSPRVRCLEKAGNWKGSVLPETRGFPPPIIWSGSYERAEHKHCLYLRLARGNSWPVRHPGALKNKQTRVNI